MKLRFTKEAVEEAEKQDSKYKYPEFIRKNAGKDLKLEGTVKIYGCPVYWDLKDIELVED